VPNIAHIYKFTLSKLWSRPYTKDLQLRIFRLQYSSARICTAIVDITSILCALYCKLAAKCSAHPPAFAMWTVVQDIYHVFIARHIQASIFKWMYRRCYCRYHDNSMRAMLQTWCQIHFLQLTLWSRSYTMHFSTPHIQNSIFSCRYLHCRWRYPVNSMRVILQSGCQMQRTTTSLRHVNCGPGHIQSIYSSACLGFKIQL
jgi:hypothetical protein